MSRRCDNCGKGPMSGNAVSHANNRTKRKWYPNLQRVRVMVERRPVTMKLCARCMKSFKYPRITKTAKRI